MKEKIKYMDILEKSFIYAKIMEKYLNLTWYFEKKIVFEL